MHSKRHGPRDLRKFKPGDLNASGAYIQAFENHRPLRILFTQCSKLWESLSYSSFLSQVSHFYIQKIKRRSDPRELRRLALSIVHNYHKEIKKTLHSSKDVSLFSTSDTNLTKFCFPKSPVVNSCIEFTKDQRLTPTEANILSLSTICRISAICGNPANNKRGFRRHSTFGGMPVSCSVQPDLGSPICRQPIGKRPDPPLTPVRQIIRTPIHPPQMDRWDPRKTPSRRLRDSMGDNLPGISFFQSNPFGSNSPATICNSVARRARPSMRRLSYPHLHIASPSRSSPSFYTNDTSNSFRSHGLASPLTIRSFNATASPCTPRTVKDDVSAYIQGSPRCLGCFAW